MDSVKIEYDKSKSSISTSTKYTKVSQKEKHEIIMKNLCSYLGIDKIEKIMDSRMNVYYRPKGFSGYQSATNAIIELTQKLEAEDA